MSARNGKMVFAGAEGHAPAISVKSGKGTSSHANHCLVAEFRLIASEPIALPVAGPGRAFERKPSRDPHFVFCGRLSVEKGMPLLVRAFARLHAHMPLARLTIVGDGPLRNEVESAVLARDLHDAVTFTGWLDPAGVDRQLETAWGTRRTFCVGRAPGYGRP